MSVIVNSRAMNTWAVRKVSSIDIKKPYFCQFLFLLQKRILVIADVNM